MKGKPRGVLIIVSMMIEWGLFVDLPCSEDNFALVQPSNTWLDIADLTTGKKVNDVILPLEEFSTSGGGGSPPPGAPGQPWWNEDQAGFVSLSFWTHEMTVCGRCELSSTGALSPVWLWSTWDVPHATRELHFYFYLTLKTDIWFHQWKASKYVWSNCGIWICCFNCKF